MKKSAIFLSVLGLVFLLDIMGNTSSAQSVSDSGERVENRVNRRDNRRDRRENRVDKRLDRRESATGVRGRRDIRLDRRDGRIDNRSEKRVKEIEKN